MDDQDLNAAAAALAQSLEPALQSVDVPAREPSEVFFDACTLVVRPDTDAGFIQRVDLSGVTLADDSYIWHGDEAVGNAIVVLQETEIGKIRWRKPDQASSPFPYAVIQTARYVRKSDVNGFVLALRAQIDACKSP